MHFNCTYAFIQKYACAERGKKVCANTAVIIAQEKKKPMMKTLLLKRFEETVNREFDNHEFSNNRSFFDNSDNHEFFDNS